MPPPNPPPGLVEILFLIVVLMNVSVLSSLSPATPPPLPRAMPPVTITWFERQTDAVETSWNIEHPIQPVAADRGKAAAGRFDRQIVRNVEVAGGIVVFTRRRRS